MNTIWTMFLHSTKSQWGGSSTYMYYKYMYWYKRIPFDGSTLDRQSFDVCSVDPHLKQIPMPCSDALGQSATAWPNCLQWKHCCNQQTTQQTWSATIKTTDILERCHCSLYSQRPGIKYSTALRINEQTQSNTEVCTLTCIQQPKNQTARTQPLPYCQNQKKWSMHTPCDCEGTLEPHDIICIFYLNRHFVSMAMGLRNRWTITAQCWEWLGFGKSRLWPHRVCKR